MRVRYDSMCFQLSERHIISPQLWLPGTQDIKHWLLMHAVKKPPTLVLMQLLGFQLLQKTVIFSRQQMVLLYLFFSSLRWNNLQSVVMREIWHSDNGKYSLRIWTWVSDLKALGKWAVIAVVSSVQCCVNLVTYFIVFLFFLTVHY